MKYKIDLTDILHTALTVCACLLFMSMFGIFVLSRVQTYNDRKQCQELGIPLYRCTANSNQSDVKIKVGQ